MAPGAGGLALRAACEARAGQELLLMGVEFRWDGMKPSRPGHRLPEPVDECLVEIKSVHLRKQWRSPGTESFIHLFMNEHLLNSY